GVGHARRRGRAGHGGPRRGEPAAHQGADRVGFGQRAGPDISVTAEAVGVRLTQFAQGGGCACKIPPGELEAVVADLRAGGGSARYSGELVVGLETGDDAAVVRFGHGPAVVATADFFTPVVDDPYDWGRIAAANALSDVYAMGGWPLVAVNLL